MRVLGVVTTCAALVLSALAGFPAAPATALSPGVSFTADDLPTWQTNGVVWALDQTQGKVIAGGTFTQLRPPAGSAGAAIKTPSLAILDAETGKPDDCQVPVTLTTGLTPTVRAVSADADGTVYIGGDFNTVGGVNVSRLAAIDVTTCTVTPFRAGAINGRVRSAALRDGVLYFGGDFDSVANRSRRGFAAVEAATGDLLPWAPDADGSGLAIGVSPDGANVAIGGDFDSVNGSASHALAVVDAATGDTVRAYSNDFIPQGSVTKHIFSNFDRFYVSNEGTGRRAYEGRLAIDWQTLSQVWRDPCKGATQATFEYGGTLYSASHAHNCEANGYQAGKRNYFNAQNSSNATLLGWDPRANDGIGEGIGPRALTVAIGAGSRQPYLWSGGDFTEINGAPQQGLTRFGTDDVGAPPTPTVYAEPADDGSIQVRWLTVVDPDDSRLTYLVYRNNSPRPIWRGTADSLWWKSPQVTFVDRKVRAGKVYTYRVRASDNINTSALSRPTRARASRSSRTYQTTVKADRPTLYWNSQRSTPSSRWVHDVGATSTRTRRLDGTVQGAALAVRSSPLRNDPSGSIRYDGRNDYLWEDEYVPGPKYYSVEAWFKTRSRKGGTIIGYGNGRPTTNNWRRVPSAPGSTDRVVYLTRSGRPRFGVDGGRRVVVASNHRLNDGRWHHVVAAQGRTGMALYVDGRRVGRKSTTRSGTYRGVWHVGGDSLKGYPQAPRTSLFSGLIDEVAVYPRALSPKRVSVHFRAAGRARR